MSKTASRLLTFFIGLPLVLSIVYCDFLNHIIFQIAVGVFALLCGNEFYNMLAKDKPLFSKPLVLIFTGVLPYISYLFILSEMSMELTPWFFICEAIILMAVECLTAKSFENSVSKIAYSLLVIFYSGFLSTFLCRLTILENSRYIISLFLIFVFMCDSLAWFFGVLFGKSSRGIVACSPNKSLVGFIGGLAGSTVCGLLIKLLFPEIMTISYLNLTLLGIFTSFAAIIGDLIESVFKRCCNIKDSGNIIPGRGGAMDSLDSILIAAPVFYICYHFLF